MTKRIPLIARGRRNRFFDADGIDDLMAMVIELTSEISVLRERQYITERVLEQNGLSVSEGIEQWQPSEQDKGHLNEDRAQLLDRVLRTLEADTRKSGEHSLNTQPQNSGTPNQESENPGTAASNNAA